MAKCGDDTLLMVISDHGFTTFRRGIDLNRWLEENGYLRVEDTCRHKEHLAGVDWSQTRAFAIDKARRELGYQPRVALAPGLAKTAAWYREHGYL